MTLNDLQTFGLDHFDALLPRFAVSTQSNPDHLQFVSFASLTIPHLHVDPTIASPAFFCSLKRGIDLMLFVAQLKHDFLQRVGPTFAN